MEVSELAAALADEPATRELDLLVLHRSCARGDAGPSRVTPTRSSASLASDTA